MAGFAADGLVLVHAAFVVFVVFGGLLAWRWPRLAWLHLPAVAWAALLEFRQWICPLTPLEQWLRTMAGESGYNGSFVEHYLLPLLYPPGLTAAKQWLLGAAVVALNFLVYGALLWKKSRELNARR